MPPLLRFMLRRILSIPISLLIVTALLYGMIIVTPAAERAELFLPPNFDRLSPQLQQQTLTRIINTHHFNDPFPVQYGVWVSYLIQGNWGWSPSLGENVLPSLMRRTPVTAELTLYSILLFIPLGLISGALAGWKKSTPADQRFRLVAFTVTNLPAFVLGILLMAVFYVQLHWFPPERISYQVSEIIRSASFHNYTGLLTIDGILNGRWEVTLDAFRHLVLPVVSLSLLHWATLGQITRTSIIEEAQKDYVIAARSHGLSENRVLWKHAFRNVLSPALTSSALSAASLFTGVIVIERTFNLKGVSDMILSVIGIPDVPSVLGFAVYSVLVVLLLTFILDIIQAIFDPRVRESVLNQ